MKIKEIIGYLSYDKSFGILTRQALELKLKKIKRFNSCLIDFNNLKKLNQLLGYNKVNNIIFNIFDEFKSKTTICGRWFSGDEILIVDKNIKEAIIVLKEISHKKGMTFKEHYFMNKGLKYIEKEIGKIKDEI